MNKPKLTYFDFDGGRGEVPRIAFTLGGVDFEDERVPFSAWAERKPGTPFGAMPVLEIEGTTVAQSNTINRYVGKLTDLYPTDAWQAALCDEVMDAVEDIAVQIVPTFNLPDAEKKPPARRWRPARSPSISRGCRIGSTRMAEAILPTIASPSPISRSRFGFGI